jgi:hypothetical protein
VLLKENRPWLCKIVADASENPARNVTCSAGTSYSASSCFSIGPKALLKTWVLHIDHQASKPLVDMVKERSSGIGMVRASKKE